MNAEQICNAVVAGTRTKKEGVRQLVGLRYDEAVATEQIFIALGGDDVVEDRAQRLRNIAAARRK